MRVSSLLHNIVRIYYDGIRGLIDTGEPVTSSYLIYLYERMFFPLWMKYYRSRGLNKFAAILEDKHNAYLTQPSSIVSWINGSQYSVTSFSAEQDTDDDWYLVNPLLINAPSLNSLAKTRGKERIIVAGNGLVYWPEEARQIPFTPRKERTILNRTVGYDGYLFRGQHKRIRPTSNCYRLLSSKPPNYELVEPNPQGQVTGTLLGNLHNFFLYDSQRLVLQEKSTGLKVIPTPFHLLLLEAPHTDRHALGRYVDLICEQILMMTFNVISEAELRIYTAHLTDYDLPVPVVGASGSVQDYVPTPFVSTTSNVAIAMLYASGYFKTFPDKFAVDWERVESLCSAQGEDGGVIYIINPQRTVLPVTELAGKDTIGAQEFEYIMSTCIYEEEIVAVIPVGEISRIFQKSDWYDIISACAKRPIPASLINKYRS